ncbi:hypothetical protein E3N88_10346 [Mikania micrantha]|uniref:Uncharacterized protein n=1 Tax=Mikania micrantha TaxID=192012 RepID=A0A5N6PAE3_9ASTR|nr:hypothetical protein E3N88_10346 [Mikania micrantha]
MKNSTMDMHVRDIKAKIARGELPSMEQIQAQRASLNLGLGLEGGATIEIPISGSGIKEGEEVMCGEATKAMFPNMFPLNPKEEPVSPPSSPSFDNMPISSVIKINKGQKAAKKQQSKDPNPERKSKEDERRGTEYPGSRDEDPEPTTGTDAAVGSNVEAQEARDQRSQAMVSDKPRMRRRKTMARRRKRTTISSDSEPDSEPSEPKSKPEHIHAYIPIVKWSFNAQQKMFTLTKINGGIMLIDIMQLMVIAEPFVFDIEKLPLQNPNDGPDGRIASKWVKARAQPSEGMSYSSEATLLPKDNSLLPKAVQDNCFGRSTLRRFKASELPILEAAEEQKLPKTLLSIFLDKDFRD